MHAASGHASPSTSTPAGMLMGTISGAHWGHQGRSPTADDQHEQCEHDRDRPQVRNQGLVGSSLPFPPFVQGLQVQHVLGGVAALEGGETLIRARHILILAPPGYRDAAREIRSLIH